MSMSRFSLWSRVAVFVAPWVLAGCATAPPLPPAPELFEDAHFAPPSEPIDPADVFKMTPDMEAYLHKTVLPMARSRGVRQAIAESLYDRGGLQLEYDATSTRTAAQAFDARQGNCLSLIIMTGAFANALNLKVTYQQVVADDMWSRSGDLFFLSGHVNLVLERAYVDTMNSFDRSAIYTIDFMPGEGMRRLRPVSQDTVLAMFMNNRAAEAMVSGQLDDAYWRVRQAIKLDPHFFSAYNTLGVIYTRHGEPAQAERVLRYVASIEPDNPRILANYAFSLEALGRAEEARAVRKHLAAVEPTPPFYWFVQGQTALHQGNFLKARELFLKEIDRAPDYHEFHYALAVADFGLDRLDEARREMALAMEDAVKRTDHDLYAAKLDKLKAWHASVKTSSLVQ